MKQSCLWVDDDRARWPGVTGFLRDNFELIECSNYEDALVQWKRQPSDVVVLDAIIPYGSARPSVDPYLGLAFAEELLQNGRNKLKCLSFFTVIEGEAIEEDVEKLRRLGAETQIVVEYFNKTDVLLTGVEQFVEQLQILSAREK